MKKNTVYHLCILGLMAALTLLLGLTPVGYIAIGPANLLTLMCIPVIIGAMILGYREGLLLGLIFGVTSLLTPVGLWLMGSFPLKTQIPLLITIFIPRLLVPVAARAVYDVCRRWPRPLAVGLGAVVGSLTNTALFLGSLYFICGADVAAYAYKVDVAIIANVILTVSAVNGLIEAAAAILVCVPVMAVANKLGILSRLNGSAPLRQRRKAYSSPN